MRIQSIPVVNVRRVEGSLFQLGMKIGCCCAGRNRILPEDELLYGAGVTGSVRGSPPALSPAIMPSTIGSPSLPVS